MNVKRKNGSRMTIYTKSRNAYRILALPWWLQDMVDTMLKTNHMFFSIDDQQDPDKKGINAAEAGCISL